MDTRLAAWARQVKARQRAVRRQGLKLPGLEVPGLRVPGLQTPGLQIPGLAVRRLELPVLWLFTDAVRMPDPLPAVALLRRGWGVVFRHDGHPGRAALARQVARLCRVRRLVLVVAGDARLAASVGAGLHLRGGRRPIGPRIGRRRLVTSSAHGRAELVRAARAGASLAFVSPLFPTPSHPGARALGPVRWAALLRSCRCPALALGGVSGRNARKVPPGAAGAGLIGAALTGGPAPAAPDHLWHVGHSVPRLP